MKRPEPGGDPARKAAIALRRWSAADPVLACPVFLMVDGTGLLVRCSRAARLRGLHASNGTPTGALMMLAGSLAGKLRAVQPDYLAIAWDGPGALDWRRSLYPPYKGSRSPSLDGGPEAVQARRFCEAAGMRQLALAEYEADDVIGALWRVARRELPGTARVIWSGDDDLLQLLGDGETVRSDFATAPVSTAGTVKEAWGVHPFALPRLRALAGDRSDGIPGLPGVGPARAAAILREAHGKWPPPPPLLEGFNGTGAGLLEPWRRVMELADPERRPEDSHPGDFRCLAEHAAWAPGSTRELHDFLAVHELSVLAGRVDKGDFW